MEKVSRNIFSLLVLVLVSEQDKKWRRSKLPQVLRPRGVESIKSYRFDVTTGFLDVFKQCQDSLWYRLSPEDRFVIIVAGP